MASKQKPVTRVVFAKKCGVSAAAVTKACKKELLPACVGQRIDMGHPAAVKYRNKPESDRTCIKPKKADNGKTGKSIKKQPAKKQQKPEQKKDSAQDKTIDIPADITDFLHMTLKDLVDQFGTSIGFVDWLKATKDIEAINEKRLKNAQTMGELVSRKLVKIGIIDPIEAAHIKLMTAGAKTISVRLDAMSKAGRTAEEMESTVIDLLASFIKPVKDRVRRQLSGFGNA